MARRCRTRIVIASSMAMLPWSHTFAGRIDELVVDSELLRGNPLGDPHERPLWVYVPPGYDDDGDAGTRRCTCSRATPACSPMWRNRTPFRQPFPEVADGQIAAGEIPPCIIVYVDAWTAVRRLAVRRLPRHRPLPQLPLRRGRPVRRRPLPHAGGAATSGRRRQVERRLRGVHHADAATRPVRRSRQPRRRLALRVLLHPRVRQDRADAARPLRRLLRTFWEDFRSRPPMSTEDDDHLVMTYGCAACFSAEDDGTRAAALRPRHRQADPRGLGPLAGVGPGAHGGALRRGAARPAGDLHRRRHAGPVVPRPRRPGDGRRARRIGVTDVFFELFDATHTASTTATRSA